MNQILQTNLRSTQNNKSHTKLHYFLKLQYSTCIILIISLIVYIGFSKLKLAKEENFSKKLLENYDITRLYSNQTDSLYVDLSSNNNISDTKSSGNSSIIGIINIPKINIYYPVFSTCSEEFLKISPCRLYGPNPGKNGNLCIAGHNYDNGYFFSNIPLLKIGDEIILSDYKKRLFSYFVNDIYEVKNDDLTPIYNFNENSKNLTLITCNNINKNRIIVRASIR